MNGLFSETADDLQIELFLKFSFYNGRAKNMKIRLFLCYIAIKYYFCKIICWRLSNTDNDKADRKIILRVVFRDTLHRLNCCKGENMIFLGRINSIVWSQQWGDILIKENIWELTMQNQNLSINRINLSSICLKPLIKLV